jgi:hypothetical protein
MSFPVCSKCEAPLRRDGLCPWARDGVCRAWSIDREALAVSRRAIAHDVKRFRKEREDAKGDEAGPVSEPR